LPKHPTKILENLFEIGVLVIYFCSSDIITLLFSITEYMGEEHKAISRSRARSTDGEDISLVRSMIFDLQEEKQEMKKTNQFILQELFKKQNALDELYEKV
jgi:hypothetical protein